MATILVVDSQNDYTAVLQSVLNTYGHATVTAVTVEEAVHRLDTGSPAVILLDLAMAGKPDIGVLSKLRARAPHVPIILLSRELTTDVESKARELGVTDVLRKGLKMDVIMEAVQRALKHAGRPAASAGPVGGKPGEKPQTIMVVDDETEIGEMVGEFLRRRKYAVKTASNGKDALAMIQREQPELVLLDIYMPGMNGVEVLRRLRDPAFPLKSPISVIMLTASQEEPLLQEALNLGAFDVLGKPVNLDELELAVAVKLALDAPER